MKHPAKSDSLSKYTFHQQHQQQRWLFCLPFAPLTWSSEATSHNVFTTSLTMVIVTAVVQLANFFFLILFILLVPVAFIKCKLLCASPCACSLCIVRSHPVRETFHCSLFKWPRVFITSNSNLTDGNLFHLVLAVTFHSIHFHCPPLFAILFFLLSLFFALTYFLHHFHASFYWLKIHLHLHLTRYTVSLSLSPLQCVFYSEPVVSVCMLGGFFLILMYHTSDMLREGEVDDRKILGEMKAPREKEMEMDR